MILSPLWAIALATSAKSFVANPLIGSATLNRWGLHVARVKFAHRIAAARRRRLAHAVPVADRIAFDRDGFVVREDFLPQRIFDGLVEQIRSYRCAACEIKEGDSINRKIAVDATTVAAIPALRALVESRDWRALLRYVGARNAEPAIFIQTIVRHTADGPVDPQTWLHADTFHPTVKAWLFLTDVGTDQGAFCYVPGSHRLTPERLDWEWRMSTMAESSSDQETREGSFRVERKSLASIGLPPPRIMGVRANTLIVADTFGFHARGPSAGPSQRVAIWALGRRSPFLPWTMLDFWTSAKLSGHAAPLRKLRDFIAGSREEQSGPAISAFDGV